MAYTLKSTLNGATLYAIGQFITKASTFLLIPIFTYYLTPEDFGIIGYIQIVVQLLYSIFIFGFYGAQTRFYYENKNQMGSFLFTINTVLLICLGILVTLFSLFGDTVYTYFSIQIFPYNPFIILAVWTVVFQIFAQMIISFHVAKKEYKITVSLQLLQFILMTTASLYLIIVYDYGAAGRVAGILIGQVLFVLISLKLYLKYFSINFDTLHLKYALSHGIPITIHLIAGIIIAFSDRVILGYYVSLEELGLYTVGYQFGMAMGVIVAAINQSWQPNYFDLMNSDKSLNDKRKEIKKYFAAWVLLVGSITMLSILFSKELLYVLTPQNFYNAAGIITLIVYGYFIQGISSFLLSPIIYYKKTFFLPIITIIVAIINIWLNFLWIPEWGMYGAAYATIVAFTLQAVLSWFIGKIYFDSMLEKRFLIILLVLLIMILTMNDLPLALNFFLYKIIIYLISIIFFIFLYKKYINFRYILQLMKIKIYKK